MTDAAALVVNGRRVGLDGVPGEERLLDTLRWRLGLRGTKDGCRSGECGACTVLVDGEVRLSCLTLALEVEGRSITTVEGAADDPTGRAVQSAFVAEGALQCGYCTPGFVMAITGLLHEMGPNVPPADVLRELGGNLCRCTGYAAIVRAVERAAKESR